VHGNGVAFSLEGQLPSTFFAAREAGSVQVFGVRRETGKE
jgi:hypothetical protein